MALRCAARRWRPCARPWPSLASWSWCARGASRSSAASACSTPAAGTRGGWAGRLAQGGWEAPGAGRRQRLGGARGAPLLAHPRWAGRRFHREVGTHTCLARQPGPAVPASPQASWAGHGGAWQTGPLACVHLASPSAFGCMVPWFPAQGCHAAACGGGAAAHPVGGGRRV